MKAATRDRYGGPEVVSVQDTDRPVATEDRVLVKVHAASVNRADLDGLYPRWQLTRLFFGLRRPRSGRLGLDVAGVVEAVGPSATRWKIGDRVFSDLFVYGMGAFAEYVSVREKAFASIPAGITFEEAATLPHSGVLALQGLRLRNGRTVKAGDKVLVDGASGNVGPFAVQIAKSLGAEVTGVCRTDKMDFVRSLGADHVIDYTKADYTSSGERYDWIIDPDGHHSVVRCWRSLRPGGAYVALGGTMARFLELLTVAPLLSRIGNRWVGMLLWWKPFYGPDVERLEQLIAAGAVKPAIDRRYPLGEIVAALRHVDEGHARGKVVITIGASTEPG